MALTKVSTDGVKDDAITKTKIPANQIEASELADNAVDTNAIADDAVTVSKIQNVAQDRILGRQSSGSGNLQELNSGNVRLMLNVADGANQTTINNNADNRVITGSGTANTLNGESSLTFNSTTNILSPQGGFGIQNVGGTLAGSGGTENWMGIKDSSNAFQFIVKTAGTNVGGVGLGTTTPNEKLHVAGNIINSTSVSGTGDSGIQIANNHRLGFDQSGTRSWSIKATNGVLNIDSGDGNSAPQVRGILFGSDTADASKLDDYEEGYWSPVAVDGQSLTVTAGTSNHASRRYVKVGKQVTAWFSITWSSSNSSANFRTRFSGLPFSRETNSNGTAAVTFGYYTGSETDMLIGFIDQNTGLVEFYENGDAMYSYSESAGDRIDGFITYVAA